MPLIFKPSLVKQGKGAKVIRIIGNQYIKSLDPFLMLDYARVRLPVGFPDHPHRGFETVAYIHKGTFYHQDSKGKRGKLSSGDVQWMTAGKGIVHSELPGSFDEDSVGFQLWINLESKNKLVQPRYQEFTHDKIHVYKQDKSQVKIIAGKWKGFVGPIEACTPAYYFDVNILEGGVFQLPISGEWNSIIFVHQGSVIYQEKNRVETQHCCLLQKSNKTQETTHKFYSQTGGKFILVSGKPLNQPIAQYGPFVMNTQQQIEKAIHDYQTGTNGFENAKNWQSKIKKLMQGKKIEQIW